MGIRADHPVVHVLLALAAFTVAAIGALPYAGGWNDGSRLAAVESIADRHTLAIDESIFCRVPPDTIARGCPPYRSDNENCLIYGTRDKLLINGHYHSDKPAVISFLMAGAYQALKWCGLPPAAERPDFFCWALTIVFTATAYVVAISSVYRLGCMIGLPPAVRLGWITSFALSTVGPAYTRHVNNHMMLLAVLSLLCLEFVRLREDVASGQVSRLRPIILGTLAGIGFNLDLGSGPVLLVFATGLVLYRCRQVSSVCFFLASTAPWVVACLGLNYAVGGVWKPMNMVPEYSLWPGSPFSAANLTGAARHSIVHLAVYAAGLLFGKHGFLIHNLALLLLLPAMALILRRRSPDRPELIFGLGWCTAAWLVYSLLSNNWSGASCSIRWFVPFLAPGYYALGIYLRDYPSMRADFWLLSAWGLLLGCIMWWNGPFIFHMVPSLWPIVGGALGSWLIYRARWGRKPVPASGTDLSYPAAAA
jgi:hypothetical protein